MTSANELSPSHVPRRPWQRYLAEFMGAFALVFIGCGAVILNGPITGGAITHAGIAFAFGLVIAAMVFALGPVSAAHFNPAVTLGFSVVGRFPWRHVPGYWAAQSAGAIAASLLHYLLLGGAIAGEAAFGATIPALWITTGAAVGLEIILTFFLMFIISAVATDRRIPGTIPGLAIGFTVIFCAMFGGPATGASMNPARSLGPALLAGGPALKAIWIYIAAPAVGAVFGSLLYEFLRDGQLHAKSAPEDMDVALDLEPGLSRRQFAPPRTQ